MSDVKDLKILLISSEISPYAKSGGLGDVVGSLPKTLRDLGADVRCVLPKYKNIKEKYLIGSEYLGSVAINLDWRNQGASVYSLKSDVPTYVLENHYYFDRDGMYGYGDDFERFAFFAKASVAFLNTIDFIPDIIHCNDWQAALAPVFLRDTFGGFLPFQKTKVVYTIHNIQYQGLFGKEILRNIGLNEGYFSDEKMEFYGNISFAKAGIAYADVVTTVSETYAQEIQSSEYGYGLDGVLRKYSYKLKGILNGIDDTKADPATDPFIYENFDINTIEIKKKNKKALQRELNLADRDVPLIGIVSRLADQKGLDLIGVAMNELLNKDIQLVILGTGDGRYEHMFKHMAWREPSKISANIFFSEELAQKIYASSDMFLMPSLFEPCGLGQIFAMRYGTIPIVRRTGGLSDTVVHYDPDTKTGNGFVFNDYVASGMMWSINEAIKVYENKEEWEIVIKNAMKCDFSWQRSAEKYIEMYLALKDNG